MAYEGSLKFDTSMDVSGFQKGVNLLGGILQRTGLSGVIKKGMQMVVDSIARLSDRIQGLPNPTANLHAVTKQYVDAQIAGTGTGDMLKSVYDTTGNGIVDNAEKVNGLTVQTAVPAGAKFTDTVYSHPNSGATAGTYRSVTVNAQGHVTAGTNPTTLAGYGITDAATKQYVDGQLAGKGAGDMLKSVYDKAGNGKVDLAENAEKVNGLTVQTAFPAWAKFTDTTYGAATSAAAGLMSAADKGKLDGVAAGANNYAHPGSGATAGTYRSVTVNAQGHVTAGANPTTLAGYGIMDAERAFAKNNAFNKSFGTAAGTVCQGNDARLSDARKASGGTADWANGATMANTASWAGGADKANLAFRADKFATARTINGVSFDGSANITIADNTKLPLAGGTLTGDLRFPTSSGRKFVLLPNEHATQGGFALASVDTSGNWANGCLRFYGNDGTFSMYAKEFCVGDIWSIRGMTTTNGLNVIFRYTEDPRCWLYFGTYGGYQALCPNQDGCLNLGTPSGRWNVVYAASGTISTSDRNEKNSIAPLDSAQMLDFVLGLKPSSYKFNEGTSGRTHWGMIAQDVEEMLADRGMESTEFAGFVKSPKSKQIETVDPETGEVCARSEDVPGEYTYGLRYEEFIAPLIASVQELAAQNKALKAEMTALRDALSALKRKEA